MTIYTCLIELAEVLEKSAAEYARKIHNAPYLDLDPPHSLQAWIDTWEYLKKGDEARARAYRAAAYALPLDVAESEV